MTKSTKKLLEETQSLGKANKELRRKLDVANASIDAIRAGNIDALVVADKKAVKVLTEKTADKIFRTLIEKMHEGAVTMNEAGMILYCNSYFANMVNLPLQKVPGTKFKRFIADSSKPHFETLFRQGWEGNSQSEICVTTNGKKQIPVLMSANVLALGDSFVLSVILTDLTSQYKNQEELRSRTIELEKNNKELEIANKDLTSFTYISSHDLQEPLRKIQILATCILQEEEQNLSETGKDYFKRMQKTARRMQALIEDLLTYSRTKNGESNFEDSNLNTIADKVIKDLDHVFIEKRAKIEVFPLGHANVITRQFHQLLANLVSNALKYTRPGVQPHIVIKSRLILGEATGNEQLLPQSQYLNLTVTDNGIGFDPQYKDRIFEVFQRLHSFDEYAGTGMGLAICKRIIENHQGTITGNAELNKGARFDVYIPFDLKFNNSGLNSFKTAPKQNSKEEFSARNIFISETNPGSKK